MGKKTGPNPTDRAKKGTKRSVLTDAQGIPLALAVDGANRNDHKMARETLEHIAVERPKPSMREPQNLCLDKGYDYPEVPALAREFKFTVHIRSRGEEAQALKCYVPNCRRNSYRTAVVAVLGVILNCGRVLHPSYHALVVAL